MPTLTFVLEQLVGGRSLTLDHLAPSGGNPTEGEEVYCQRANRNIPVVYFRPEQYQRLHALLAPYLENLPHPYNERFNPPGMLERLTGRGLDIKPNSVPVIFNGKVAVPWNTIYAVSEWLQGKLGKKGISARNALERVVFPDQFTKPDPAPSPREPALPFQPRQLTPGEIAVLKVTKLERLCDLILSDPRTIPPVKEFAFSVINGSNQEELIACLQDDDEPDSVWLMKDENGYYAALLGPLLGLDYERRVGRSSIGFKLRTCSYTELRQCRDLRVLLMREDRLRDGRMIITTHANKPLATMITLRRLLELFGFDASQTPE